MPDLRVEFCGLKLRNPLIAGSGDYGRSVTQFKRLVGAGLGAIVMKSVTDAPPLQGQSFTEYLCLDRNLLPWKHGREVGGFFSRGGGMLGEAEWLAVGREQIRLAREQGVVPIGNICAANYESWAHLARLMVDQGVPCLELNFGNPHFVASQKPLGAKISQDQEILVEIIRSVRAAVPVPLMVKLSPQVSDMEGLARASLEAGAQAVTISHRFQGLIIDVEARKPLTSSWGGYGGSWQMPLTAAYVARVARVSGLEICGSGGVGSAGDVLQLLLCGASTVQLTTALILHGPGLVAGILADLVRYCARQGTGRLAELKGSLLGAIADYARLPPKPAVSLLDPGHCLACREKPCGPACYFDAVTIAPDGRPRIDQNCCGCGFCLQMCPFEGALGFERAV